MNHKRFCILVNPFAGNGRALKVFKKVEAILSSLPIRFRSIITQDISMARLKAAEASARGEIVVTVGGDGSARAVAGVLHDCQGKLALIPAGRGNDLARMLKIPSNPIEACKLLPHAVLTAIDMASVDDQPFLGICSLGFDSLANKMANKTKLVRGSAAYLYSGIYTLCRWKPIKFNVTIDGVCFAHEGYTVAVANAQNYGGGLYLAPHASIQDGLLDVILIGCIPKWRMIRNIPRLFRGAHTQEPGFTVIQGKTVHIEADPQFTVFADGDAICAPPVTVKIMPAALQVLTPSAH